MKLVAGKHSCVGRFSVGVGSPSGSARLEKEAMLVYVGQFDSMDGPVEVTEEQIDRLIENHNARAKGGVAEQHMPPLQVDHSSSARDTVGRVPGEFFKGVFEHEGKKLPALFCRKIVTLGKDNVERVEDGRWSNISIGADLDAGVFNELSITPFPAAPNATLLGKGILPSAIADILANGDYVQPQMIETLVVNGMDKSKASALVKAYVKKFPPTAMPTESELINWIKSQSRMAGDNMAKEKKVVRKISTKSGAAEVVDDGEGKLYVKVNGMNIGYVDDAYGSAEALVKKWLEGKLSRLSEGDTGMDSVKKHLMEQHGMDEHTASVHACHMVGHVMSEKKFGEEEAKEHLAKLSEEEVKKLAEDVKAKLASPAADPAELSEEEKQQVEASKKLAAAKPEMVKLAKGVSAGMKATRLALRKETVSVRLSKLRACAKLTPAEQKKVNIAELSAKSDAEIEAFFSGIEMREQVIDPTVRGTTNAVNLSKLQKQARLARLEAEAKKDFGHKLSEEDEKALEGSTVVHVDTAPHEHEDHFKHLESILGEHPQKDAILAHVRKMCDNKQLSEVSPEHAENSEKQMKALVNEHAKLQNEFQSLVKMIGDVAGISATELE